jgi:hypothetical protein
MTMTFLIFMKLGLKKLLAHVQASQENISEYKETFLQREKELSSFKGKYLKTEESAIKTKINVYAREII